MSEPSPTPPAETKTSAQPPPLPQFSFPPPQVSPRLTFEAIAGRSRRATLALRTIVVLEAIAILLALADFVVSRVYPESTWDGPGSTPVRVVVIAAVLFALVYGVGYLACIVLFLRWMHRAYRNLTALGATALLYTPGWAVAYWFIPILLLFRPYQAARELYHASDPDDPDPTGAAAASRPVPGWFNLWWATWLSARLLGQAARRTAKHGELPGFLTTSQICAVLGSCVGIAAALLAIRLIRETSARQEARAASMSAAPASTYPLAATVPAV